MRQSPLWGLLQLEGALSDANAPPYGCGRRTGPGCGRSPPVTRWPGWSPGGAYAPSTGPSGVATLAADRLVRWDAAGAVLDDLGMAGVRPPAGYVDGLRGLIPLVTQVSPADPDTLPRLDDDAEWDAALADLTRAVELDAARRQRWLSALAACAELRDDPVARESAARWTLDMAALAHADTLDSMRRGPAGLAADRYDPMPDAADRRAPPAGHLGGCAAAGAGDRRAPVAARLGAGPLGVRAGAGPAGGPGGGPGDRARRSTPRSR